MTELIEQPTDAYWLGHCHGFRVDAAGKRLGVVEDVLYGAEGRVSALAIRGGLIGTRLELVPVEAVESLVARDKRITLRPPAKPS